MRKSNKELEKLSSRDKFRKTIKNVDVDTDTGKKNVDKELDRDAGGKCVVKTDTGDIKLSLKR